MNSHPTDLRRLYIAGAIALLVAGLFSLAVSPEKSAAKYKRGPAGLKFYKPPKKLPSRHGKLIWARKAGGNVPLRWARWTRLVLYSSKSVSGKRIAVSGSVSVPKGRPPKGGWPVITYAHGTTGIADRCAPSRDYRNGPATDYIIYVNPQLNDWLKAGYAVVRTDYEGLGTPGIHPYLIGESEGRGVLDIVRAARSLDRRIGKRYMIAGHSQGGQAALFAAGLAQNWVPELNLRGTVAYAPASHMQQQGEALGLLTEPSEASALAGLIIQGANTVTRLGLGTLLSDSARGLFPETKSQCMTTLTTTASLGGIAPAQLLRQGADTTPLLNLLAEQNPAVKTAQPILLAQGLSDSTVLPLFTDQLDTELVAAGSTVDYQTYPGVAHGAIVAASELDAFDFITGRLPAGG